MGIDQWPFYPENLTDVMGPNGSQREVAKQVFSYIQTGSSLKTGFPLTIVEKEDRIEMSEPGFNWEEFCKYFRLPNENGKINCPNGNERCEKWDRLKALDVLKKVKNDKISDHSEPFHCHLGLIDMISIIYVSDIPVAGLYAGQKLGTHPNHGKEKIIEEINKLNIIRPEDILKDLPLVHLSEDVKRELISKIDKIPPYSGDMLTKISDEAKRISHIAEVYWKTYKEKKENEFLDQIRNMDLGHKLTQDDIKKTLNQIIKEICEFCGIEWMAFFADSEMEGRILDLVAFHNIPNSEELKQNPPHFNWNKSGVNFVNLPESNIIAEEKKTILKKGLKHKLEEKKYIIEAFNNLSYFVPQIRGADNEKTLICFGPFTREINYEKERTFLQKICDILSDDYRHGNRLTTLKYKEAQWSEIADLIAHQVRSVMQPIQSGINIIMMKLRGDDDITNEKAFSSEEKVKGHLKLLKEHSKMTLGGLRDEIMFRGRFKKEDFKMTDICEIIRDLKKSYEDATLERNIEIRLNFDDLLKVEVEIVPSPFETALGNIIQNATKYAVSNSYIEINVNIDSLISDFAYNCTISVRNIGPGITSEEKQEIFKKGVQGKMRGDHPGEGLGLFESRSIIASHKGKLWCESHPRYMNSNDNDWLTTFYITIPVRQ